jgi:hypothetical protein
VDWARTHLFQTEFTYFVSVNITEDITSAELKSLWPKVTEHLAYKGVIALWVCEVSRRSNRFNFHLLLRSETPDIKAILKAKFKKLGIKTNIKPERYDPGRRRFSVRYMTKAKTPKYRDGELITADRWKAKRVLMNPEDKIRKYGYIGEFFPKGMNKERIWEEIKKHERKISEGLQQPGAEEYAEFIHDLIGGYYSLKRVRRSVGYFGVPRDWVPQIDDDLFNFPSNDRDLEERQGVLPGIVDSAFFQEPFVTDDFQRGVSPAIGQMFMNRETSSDRGNDSPFDGIVLVPNFDSNFHDSSSVKKPSPSYPTPSRLVAHGMPQKSLHKPVERPQPSRAWKGLPKRSERLLGRGKWLLNEPDPTARPPPC